MTRNVKFHIIYFTVIMYLLLLFLLFNYIYLFGKIECVLQHTCLSQVGSSLYMGPRCWTQAVRLYGRYLYLLSHLSSPMFVFFSFSIPVEFGFYPYYHIMYLISSWKWNYAILELEMSFSAVKGGEMSLIWRSLTIF